MQCLPSRLADTKPTKPAIKSSTLPRMSSQGKPVSCFYASKTCVHFVSRCLHFCSCQLTYTDTYIYILVARSLHPSLLSRSLPLICFVRFLVRNSVLLKIHPGTVYVAACVCNNRWESAFENETRTSRKTASIVATKAANVDEIVNRTQVRVLFL